MKRSHAVLASFVASFVFFSCSSDSTNAVSANDAGAGVDATATDTVVKADSGTPTEAGSVDANPDTGTIATCTDSWCPQVTPDNSPSLSAIWGSSPSNIWITGDGGILLHWDGTAWKPTFQGVQNLNSVWGTSASNVWATGDFGTLLHFDGTNWTTSTLLAAAPSTTADGGANPDGGPADGGANVDAGAADPSDSVPLPLSAVWGTSASDVWIVGDLGRMWHYDGHAWTYVNSGTTTNLAWVWPIAPNDVWVAGDRGYLAHYDGTAWTPSVSGTTNNLGGIWGSAPNDVWASGKAQTLLHWNGSAWAPVPIMSPGDLNGLGGTGAKDVWATGDFGALYHYDGTGWTSSASGTMNSLVGIWHLPGGSPQDLWIVGDLGTILRHK